jgi:hypothetical protein
MSIDYSLRCRSRAKGIVPYRAYSKIAQLNGVTPLDEINAWSTPEIRKVSTKKTVNCVNITAACHMTCTLLFFLLMSVLNVL